MNWLRIRTVVRRQTYVLWRTPAKWFDIAVWPTFDVIMWGSLGVFVAQENDASRAGATYLLAGIMLFHVLFQAQVGVATGFMEETWSRNVLNIMTTPVTEAEYAAGLALYALLKSTLGMAAISLVSLGFFGFGLGEVGVALLPIVAVLLVVGFAVALVSIGLILRFGQSAEIMTWGMMFLLLAVSGVFNPISALPDLLEPLGRALPTTYAFAAARRVLDGGDIPWDDLARGLLGAAVTVSLAFWFVVRMLATFRRRGFVTRFG